MKKLLALTLTIWLSVFIAITATASPKSGGGDGFKIESWQSTDGSIPSVSLPSKIDISTCTLLYTSSATKSYECEDFVFGVFMVYVPIESEDSDFVQSED